MLLLYIDPTKVKLQNLLFKNISCYYYIQFEFAKAGFEAKFKNISCYYYISYCIIFLPSISYLKTSHVTIIF